MARHPSGSDQLRQQKRPHHYQSTPEEEAEADKLLERLAEEMVKERGITKEEALKHLRHWV